VLEFQTRVIVAAKLTEAKSARLREKSKKRIISLGYKCLRLKIEYRDFKKLWNMDFKYNKTASPLSYLINCAKHGQQKCPSCSAALRLYPGKFGFRSVVLSLSHSSGLPFELFMISPNVILEAKRTLS
jgi:hypothetical protein